MSSKQIYAKVLLRVRRLTLKYSRIILLWEVTSFTLCREQSASRRNKSVNKEMEYAMQTNKISACV